MGHASPYHPSLFASRPWNVCSSESRDRICKDSAAEKEIRRLSFESKDNGRIPVEVEQGCLEIHGKIENIYTPIDKYRNVFIEL